MAEDSGLEIDALGGAPGVESARFGGVGFELSGEVHGCFSSALRAAAERTTARRASSAHWRSSTATGDVSRPAAPCEGEIAEAPRGEGGFGYDPIFYYPPFGCTFAEAGERKASVSHRAQAFEKLQAISSEAENR